MKNLHHILLMVLIFTWPLRLIAQKGTPPTAAIIPSYATNLASGLAAETEALLKYQEFLRKETDQNSARLNDLIQHTKDWLWFVGAIVIALAALTTWLLNSLGKSTYKDFSESVKNRLDTEAQKRLQDIETDARQRVERMMKEFRATSRSAFDERLRQHEDAYRRRQDKYLKLLRSFFSKLFESSEEFRKQWLGPHVDGGRLRGKRILWVDDDSVGIALLVELLTKCCGVAIEHRRSTVEALNEPLAGYHLVVSNLRRDPDDNAGVLLTEAIRQQKRSKIPVVIFTRAEYKALYREALTQAGVNGIATSEQELLATIAGVFPIELNTPRGASDEDSRKPV